MSKSQFIKLSGFAFIAGSFAFISMLRGSFANPIISSILLAAGMLGLRAGYGESVGRFGQNILLIGVAGTVLIYLGIFTLPHIETFRKFYPPVWEILPYAGLAVLLLALTLFGLTALRRKPMSRFNWLPVLAGIWFPVIYFALIPYLLTNNGNLPEQLPWAVIEIPMEIQFLALCLFGFILVTDMLDVEILINRTLVYGALTASVVGLYVLIVGGLGMLFQTQNNLANIVIAILLIAFLFQPLRRCVQDIADGFVPVPPSRSPSAQHENKTTMLKREDTADSTLQGHPLLLARVVWVLIALLSISIFILGTVAQYDRIREPCSEVQPEDQANCWPTENALHKLGLTWEGLANFYTPIATVAVLPIILIGCAVFWRKSESITGLLFSLGLVTMGSVSANQDLIVDLFHAFPNFRVPITFIHFLSNTAPGMFLCLFPDGRFVPRWTRWLLVLWAADVLAVSVSNFLMPSFGNSLWRQYLDPPGMVLLIVVGIYAFIFRYRYVAGPRQREQIKWIIVAGVVGNIFMIGFKVLGLFWQPGFFDLFVIMVYSPLYYLGILLVAVCFGISISRYRLWDIDLIINRTLVYGALSVGIVLLYILVVGALSIVSQTIGNFLISLLATGLIAFLFQPLRERLQRAVNRFMYGERNEPYIVLSQLEQRLETILAPTAILSTTVETIGRALKLPFVEIRSSDDQAKSVSFGEPQARTIAFPLAYQNEAIGELRVAPRTGESLSSADQNLVKDLARQIGIAIHAARTTADLQRSRERLVLAREEERRRLRRDLHDDLAPTLASLGLTASTVADLIPTNPTTATKLVKELQSEIRETVGNIRRLVYDLRPPTLDELGLLAAVHERAAQYSNAPNGFHVTVDAPAELPALPAAVEVAAYRIVQEALENVSKHSQARTCTIRFTNHSGLVIEITDDGIGLPANIIPGVGLRSMRERAEELGGSCVIERGANRGTCVLACLPIGGFNGTLARPDRG